MKGKISLVLLCLIVALFAGSVDFFDKIDDGGHVVAAQDSRSDGMTGNASVFVGSRGQIGIALDIAGHQGCDGIVDRYYWYRSNTPFPKGLAVRLQGVKITDKGYSLSLTHEGRQITFLTESDGARQDLMLKDLQTFSAFSSSLSSGGGSLDGNSQYTLKGGYELGRLTPPRRLLLDPVPDVEEDPEFDLYYLGELISGGSGATSCSVSSNGSSCSVSCASNYSAYCYSKPRCKCIGN